MSKDKVETVKAAVVATKKSTTTAKTATTVPVAKKSTTTKSAAAASTVIEKKTTTKVAATTPAAATVEEVVPATAIIETATPESDVSWNSMDMTAGGSFVDTHPVFVNASVIIFNPMNGLAKGEIKINAFINCIKMARGKDSADVVLILAMGQLYRYSVSTCQPLELPVRISTQMAISFLVDLADPNIIYFSTPSCVCSFNLAAPNEEARELLVVPLPRGLCASDDGSMIAVFVGNTIRVLHVRSGAEHTFSDECHITSLTFVPGNQHIISYGTTIGRVHRMTVDGVSAPVAQSYVHWHSTPVSTLTYSADGLLFFTGAFENVLAVWTVATMRKLTVPRLGGAITGVTIDPTTSLVAISLSSNTIRILQLSDMSIVHSIVGVRHGVAPDNQIFGLHVDPRTNALAMHGSDGTAVLYDPHSLRVTANIIVSPPKNTQTSTKQARTQVKTNRIFDGLTNPFMLPETPVTCMAFHPKRHILATYDTDVASLASSHVLKIWRVAATGDYRSVFSSSAPHSTRLISAVFHPKLAVLLTTSESDFKLWQKRKTVSGQEYWTVIHTGSYQGLSCGAAAFSHDGNVFAVGAGHIVTIWNFATRQLITALTRTGRAQVRDLAFIKATPSLIANYETGACVWDLATLMTTVDIPAGATPHIMAYCARNDHFALASDKSLVIFDARPAVPVPTFHRAMTTITHMVFGVEADESWLYFSHNRNYIGAVSTASPDTVSSATPSIVVESNTVDQTKKKKKENFAHLKKISSKHRDVANDESNESTPIAVSNQLATNQVFNSASHIIPGVQSIYQSYMDSMLTTNTVASAAKSSRKDNNVDSVKNVAPVAAVKPAIKTNKHYKAAPPAPTFNSMKSFFDKDPTEVVVVDTKRKRDEEEEEVEEKETTVTTTSKKVKEDTPKTTTTTTTTTKSTTTTAKPSSLKPKLTISKETTTTTVTAPAVAKKAAAKTVEAAAAAPVVAVKKAAVPVLKKTTAVAAAAPAVVEKKSVAKPKETITATRTTPSLAKKAASKLAAPKK
eukprot:gene2508-2862_t